MFIGNIINYSQLIIFSGLCPDGRTFDEHYTIWEIVSKNHLYEGFIVFNFSQEPPTINKEFLITGVIFIGKLYYPPTYDSDHFPT